GGGGGSARGGGRLRGGGKRRRRNQPGPVGGWGSPAALVLQPIKPPPLCRRLPKRCPHGVVELADAAETRQKRNFSNRQRGLLDQLDGEMDAPRARNGARRSAQMFGEQPAKLARSDAESNRQRFYTALVQRSFRNQPERAENHRRTAQPRGRARSRLRMTASAGTKAGRLSGGRAGKVSDILEFRRMDGADRTAIDSRRNHASEETAIEAPITAQSRLVANFRIQPHMTLRRQFGVLPLISFRTAYKAFVRPRLASFGHHPPQQFLIESVAENTCLILQSDHTLSRKRKGRPDRILH